MAAARRRLGLSMRPDGGGGQSLLVDTQFDLPHTRRMLAAMSLFAQMAGWRS